MNPAQLWALEFERLAQELKAARAERERRREQAANKRGAAPAATSSGKSLLDDEWKVKRGKSSQQPAASRPKVADPYVAGETAGIGARAAALSKGYAPAVLKIVSYAHGVTRATATAHYVQRDDVQLETHDGRILADHDAIAAEMQDWEKDFENRQESQDVVTMRLTLSGVPEENASGVLEDAIKAGFDGHKHAWRIESNDKGELTARVVVVLAGYDPTSHNEHGSRDKERFKVLEGKNGPKLVERYDSAIKDRIGAAVGLERDRVSLVVGKPGHGTEAVAYRVGQLIKAGGATSKSGQRLGQPEQARAVAREWKGVLNSFKPRDTMHMILSAKAGVSEEALTRAVRGFLHEQFGEHKFAFALHTDKAESGSHIHAHAIIAVRSEAGEKLRTGPAVLNAWRESYAAHAQAQGLKIVATRAMEQASSQSYGSKDRAIVQTADKPRAGREERDRAYARENANLIENARKRIDTARTNPARAPVTERQRLVVNASLSTWQQHLATAPTNMVAQETVFRLSIASALGATIHKLDDRRKDQSMAGSSAEMKSALKDMNREAVIVAASLSGDEKTAFMERSSAMLMQLATVAELKHAQEQGATTIKADALAKLAGGATAQLVERADRIAKVEAQEARGAEKLAQDAERLARSSRGEIEPTRLSETDTARVVATEAQAVAARERAEATEAAEAAALARQDATQQLDRSPEQTGDRLAALEREQRVEMDRLRAERETQQQRGEGQRGPRQKQ